MRHLGSILLALLLAPATWLLTGTGLGKFAEARADSSGFDIDLTLGLAAMVGAGLCYALLILPRISPLGLVLAGLGFLGLVVWRVVDLDGFNQAVPADFLDLAGALRIPADGYAALLALPLLGTLFSARRWRRHDHPPAEYAAGGYADQGYPGQEYTAPIATNYQVTPSGEHPTVPNMPTAGYPPPPYPPGGDDPTWPFPNDTETTRRL
jgi:hypothetical protein